MLNFQASGIFWNTFKAKARQNTPKDNATVKIKLRVYFVLCNHQKHHRFEFKPMSSFMDQKARYQQYYIIDIISIRDTLGWLADLIILKRSILDRRLLIFRSSWKSQVIPDLNENDHCYQGTFNRTRRRTYLIWKNWFKL